MASIFAGVPFLDFGYQRPAEGSGFASNFAAGVKMRQDERQLALQEQQEQRLQLQEASQQLARNLQVKAAEFSIKENMAKLDAMVQAKEREVKSFQQLPGLYTTASTVRDWTNPVELFNYGSANPEITFTKQWAEFIQQHENALARQSLEQRAAEANKARLDAARLRANYQSAFSTDMDDFLRYEEKGWPNPEMRKGYMHRLGMDDRTLPAKIKVYREIKSMREAGDFEGADLLERSALPANTPAMQTILEKKVLGINRTIGSFKNLLNNAPIDNLTVGPVAFTLRNSTDFLAGLFGDKSFETVGGQTRAEVKTLLEAGVKQAAREILDEPSSNLAVSERQMLEDVVSGDRFFTTAPEVKTKLRALLPVFEKSLESAKQAYRKGVIPFDSKETNEDDLMSEVRGSIARYGINSSEARKAADRLRDFRNRKGQ